jgi:hypothetical protein
MSASATLTQREIDLYDLLISRSAKYVNIDECFQRTNQPDWIRQRVVDLRQHHMVLELLKPRLINALLAKTNEEENNTKNR